MYRFAKKLSVVLLAGAMVSAAFCTEDAPTHECTSWMLFPDVAGENTTILHKNRDSQSRYVIVRKGSDNSGRVWLGMGGDKGCCMAVNTCGLAGVMNSGEKCTDNSKNPDAKRTPLLLEEIISSFSSILRISICCSRITAGRFDFTAREIRGRNAFSSESAKRL